MSQITLKIHEDLHQQLSHYIRNLQRYNCDLPVRCGKRRRIPRKLLSSSFHRAQNSRCKRIYAVRERSSLRGGLCELGRLNFVCARATSPWIKSAMYLAKPTINYPDDAFTRRCFLPSTDRQSFRDFLREATVVALRRIGFVGRAGLPTLMHFASRRWYTRFSPIPNGTFHSPNGLGFFYIY